MAIRHHSSWEAAIVTLCKNYISPGFPDLGRPIVYVDYLEAAPWNWTIPGIQDRRFKSLGAVLLRAAIEQSFSLGCDGRVGLHALPQPPNSI